MFGAKSASRTFDHLMVGVGEPVAMHCSVVSLPCLTVWCSGLMTALGAAGKPQHWHFFTLSLTCFDNWKTVFILFQKYLTSQTSVAACPNSEEDSRGSIPKAGKLDSGDLHRLVK
jgi:hypothetical protein